MSVSMTLAVAQQHGEAIDWHQTAADARNTQKLGFLDGQRKDVLACFDAGDFAHP